MSNTTISANMSLPIPIVGQETGPQWASDLNSCMTLIDQHDHSQGNGVPITPAGMSINADLALNANNLTLVRTVRFSAQSAAITGASPDLSCIYVAGVDLYYNDGNGNQVRITQSGGVAGSPGSISSLASPASASYSSANATFVWQSNTNVAASLDCRNVLLRNSSVSSFALTLSPPNAMGADITLTLPQPPASTKIMTMTNAGAMGVAYDVDNATLIVSSNLLQINALGVQTANIAANAVTRAKQAAVGQQISSSCATFTTSSTSLADVTNLTVTITTTGRPVVLAMIPDGSTALGSFAGVKNNTLDNQINIAFLQGSTVIAGWRTTAGDASQEISLPYWFLDTPAAGTYTYKVQAATGPFGGGTVSVLNYKFMAYEL